MRARFPPLHARMHVRAQTTPKHTQAICSDNLWTGLTCYDTDASPVSYPIDWNSVTTAAPTWYGSDWDIGECLCDMTSDLCDQNCECDADCTATEQALFTGSLEEGRVSWTYPMCVDEDFMKVNRRGEMVTTIANGLLCVDTANDPSRGTFYDKITSIASTDFDSIVSARSYSYEVVTAPISSTTSSAYKFEDRVGAAYMDSSTLYSGANYGYLSVPGKDQRGRCSGNRFARFAKTVDSDEGECDMYTSDLAADCASVFDASGYGNDLWIAKTPSSVPSAPSGYVLATVSSVWIKSPTNGIYSYYGAGSVPSPVYSNCTCSFAVDTIIYTLNHTQAGAINSAEVDVVLTQVSADSFSSCAAARHTPKFMIRYYPSTSPATSTPTGAPTTTSPTLTSSPTLSPSTNIPTAVTSGPTAAPTTAPTLTLAPTLSPSRPDEPLPRSGNPGYRPGFPLLAGSLATNGTSNAINRYVDGLVILGHESETSDYCASSPDATGRSGQAVRFGRDTLVGCKLSLTLAQLSSLCTAGLASYLASTAAYVAQWGNTSHLNTGEWKAVSFDSYSTSSAAWDSNTKSCTGIGSKVNWQFLTKRSGSLINPQNEVLAARVKYNTDTWTFTGTNDSVPEDFVLYATATFYDYDDATTNDTPESPPLFPKLPHDTLYPFASNAAGGTRAGAAAIVWLPGGARFRVYWAALLATLLSCLIALGGGADTSHRAAKL